MKTQKQLYILQCFYFFAFFGSGSIAPLLSVYLNKSIGLSGFEIGIIMSIGPVVTIFFQPFWGILSDKTNSPTAILKLCAFFAGLCGLGYLFIDQFVWIFVIATMIAVFQSAIVPISDSITIKYTSEHRLDYGNVRMYGALGFGIAVFIMGRLSEVAPSIIFLSFFAALLICSFATAMIPKEKAAANRNPLKGASKLFIHKKYMLFLIVTFMIFSPNLANNTFFGLFVEGSGGTYTGIGIAFLIAVLSEVPFMKIAGAWIRKFGLLEITLFSGIISLVRWIFYFTEPNLTLIYATAFLQGFGVGLFIPAGLQYIRKIAPAHLIATSITFYSAIGNGLGNWFNTFIGGIIFDHYSIFYVYLFFSLLTVIGLGLNVFLLRLEKQEALINSKLNENPL
ncbi:MFS transporter [Niallia taxi]|uniref:MFS transporter n=1 Tax=Niallia taxi TaxID=2499688 RepID=UPI00203A3E8D|nr:MFS transporter [Niallia taxi]MCM3214363.1 MFS transporter [Niallia taxi]